MKALSAKQPHEIIETVLLTTATVFEVDWKDLIAGRYNRKTWSVTVRHCKQFAAYMLSRYLPKEHLEDIFNMKQSGIYDLVRWGKLLAFNNPNFASVRRLIQQKHLGITYLQRA